MKEQVLGPGEVLLMSEYNPESFDSRYFGPLPAATLESVATPLLTWNHGCVAFICSLRSF